MNDEANALPAETPAAKPAAVLKGDRSRMIPLRFPVEFDGKEYSSVTVRRLNGTEVAAFYREPNADRLPMFDCPAEVIDALDADDSADVMKAVTDFLPLAMRPAIE